ncbi:aldehyde dehydrogenase family protein [Streptomyces hygroscopicus]|uniref:aldehyde dehydrogenase family protein n=1 Tax=Streptomyces hygroscopicus TaxID=1912 RepID=UPI0007674CEB|nr:aldehyde dehydrogenase family protein [Streptomyces hygroscopicus]
MKTVTPDDVIGRVEKGLLIAGRWRPATAGATFAVYDPATGRPLCEVADATPDDGAAALDAAHAAQADWAAVPPRHRAEILRCAHDLLLERVEEFPSGRPGPANTAEPAQ